jgi:hypothetical protein
MSGNPVYRPDLAYAERDVVGVMRKNFNEISRVLELLRTSGVSNSSVTVTGLTEARASELFEPIITPKRSAFNKNFGTGEDDVARGNHEHPTPEDDNCAFLLCTLHLTGRQVIRERVAATLIVMDDVDAEIYMESEAELVEIAG